MTTINRRLYFAALMAAAAPALAATLVPGAASAQALPNPYRLVDGWAHFRGDREVGAVGDVDIDPDGEHVWAIIRCDADGDSFGWECLDSDLDPVVRFDSNGLAVESFGGGMFIWPHGIDVDAEGNVWVTDAVTAERTPDGRRGHQVVKFSPTGDVLLVLGTPGEPGSGRAHFNAPSDVVVAPNGDVFVADGFVGNIVLKFGEGMAKFIMKGLKREVSKSLVTMLGALAMAPAAKKFGKSVDKSEFGAAPLLGVNGFGLIGHGSSDAKSIASAIMTAATFAERNVNDHITETMRENADVFGGGSL